MADNDDESPALDDRERAALATWEVAAPPAGFADRAAAGAGPVPLSARHAPAGSRAAWFVALGAAVVLAATGGILIATRGDAPATIGAASGAVTAGERRTVAIGGRGVVVAEPGAVLAWSVDTGGAARVEHGAGTGFYRVDHGRPFVVTTPLGEVTVTGTCFRIEVIMRPTKQTMMSGAIGATLAAAVVVTVYEGGVVVADSHRTGSVKVAPGERATLTGEGAPTVAGAGGGDIAPPMPSATRDQLLARDEMQRQRIAGLTARVNELERVIADHGGDGGDGGPMLENWNNPSPDELAAWAKQCKVRFDIPPIMGSSPFTVGPERAAEYGLTDAEIDPVNRALFELHKQWLEQVRAIYIDVVGEGADSTLSAQAMMQEIQDKSPAGTRSAIQARIAQERAGLVQPPADWSNAPPIERLFRSLAAIGDEAERAVGKAIGPDRAHALRAKDGGWPSKMEMSGCNDPEDN